MVMKKLISTPTPLWVAVVAFVVALISGGSIGAMNNDRDEQQAAIRAANARALSAEQQAASADDRALAKAETELGSRAAQLDARTKELDDREAAAADQAERTAADLARREAAVTGAEAAKKANEFSDGVWEVGSDIQPGKYKAPDATADCYWAKLRANDDIIDNDLSKGPTTVTIEPTVSKFKTSRCGVWQKVG